MILSSVLVPFLLALPSCMLDRDSVRREGKQEGWGLIQSSAVPVARLNSVLTKSAEARRGPKKVWG